MQEIVDLKYGSLFRQRLANVAPEEPSAPKEDASSSAGEQPIEPAKDTENTDKKSTKKKEVEPASTPESAPEE